MSSIVCYESDGNILQYYTQWDVNQKLVIKGADTSSAPNFHFSNSIIDNTYVVKSQISGGGLVANVPDEILQYSASVVVHIQYRTGETEYEVRIPVRPRKKPDNYVYTDTESGGGTGGGSGSVQIGIANNLITNDSTKALSAAQGVVVKSLIDTLSIEKLDKTELNSSINAALALAKQSGDFKGEDGEAGRGIVSITRTGGTGAAGTTDTYTITYTDNTSSTFNVYNGANGVSSGGGDGSGTAGSGENGATFIPAIDSSGNLSWSNNKGLPNPQTINIKGSDGAPGRGIVSIDRTSGDGSAGSVDTYTIMYTDDSTSTFTVYNGMNGSGGNAESGTSGVNGATFIPYIDSDGYIFWTNDKELENPDPVLIKPVRGIDYWTDDDIAQIKGYVDDAILGGEW